MHSTEDGPVSWTDPTLASDPEARHVTLVQCAAPSVGPVERLAVERSGQTTRVIDATRAPRYVCRSSAGSSPPSSVVVLLAHPSLKRQAHL